MATSKRNIITSMWYRGSWWSVFLLPLSLLFYIVTLIRRRQQRIQAKQLDIDIPIIVVGNITVGGTGKTPLLISIVEKLKQQGYSPGIVSRGYGSEAPHYPYEVTSESPISHAGDEPWMVAHRTQCPVFIDADRPAAVRALVEKHYCDLIISDDGLQHYRLPRDIEIAVVDGSRGLGNGRLLPAGPLRETAARLLEVDYLVINGPAKHRGIPDRKKYEMRLNPVEWRRVYDGNPVQLGEQPWYGEAHAIAGIGNPGRFFKTLSELEVSFIEHRFADHHHYRSDDLDFNDDLPVVMTEKDAGKCRALLKQKANVDISLIDQFWYLVVVADVSDEFIGNLMKDIDRKSKR